jgi:hypothetical protein
MALVDSFRYSKLLTTTRIWATRPLDSRFASLWACRVMSHPDRHLTDNKVLDAPCRSDTVHPDAMSPPSQSVRIRNRNPTLNLNPNPCSFASFRSSRAKEDGSTGEFIRPAYGKLRLITPNYGFQKKCPKGAIHLNA